MTVLAVLAALLPAASAAQPGGGEVTRTGTSSDPIQASIQMSRDTFADGEATLVIIGRADDFADNLAGAALAGLDGDGPAGPLLFTEGGPDGRLSQATYDEAERVLGPPPGCSAGDAPHVYIVGGTDAVSTITGEGFAEGGWCVERLAGPTRVETAIAVAEAVGGPSPDRVLLARHDDWADSATGGAYAAATGTPIRVTPTGQLTQSVHDHLAAHTPAEIVLLGGEAALSATVEAEAAAYAPTRRVAGDTRDLTAIAIARELWGGGSTDALDGATLVPGFAPGGWAYALAGAIPSAARGWPELYTQADVLTTTTGDVLAAAGVGGVLLCAPTALISDQVAAAAAEATGGAAPGGPGGTPFAYAVWDDGVHHVDASRVDTTVFEGPVRGDLSWSPDGTELAVAVADGSVDGPEAYDTAGDIAIVGVDGQATTDLQSTPGSQEFTQPVWSPDGDRLAVIAVEEDGTVLYDRAIGGLTVGSLHALTSPADGNAFLGSPQAWSRDGGRIAFTLDGELAIVDRRSGEILRLGEQAVDPAFSPGGLAVAYTYGDQAYVMELGQDPAFARAHPIGPISGRQIQWLDDDRLLLAGEDTTDGTRAVWVLHRDGETAPTLLADVGGPEIGADLAPDGGDLGITSGESGAVVVDATGEFAFGTDAHVTGLRFQPSP